MVVDTNSSNDSTNHSNDKTKYGIVAIAGVEREIKFYSVFKGVEKDLLSADSWPVEEADNDDDDDEDDETKQARENILDRALRLRFIGSFAKEAWGSHDFDAIFKPRHGVWRTERREIDRNLRREECGGD